MLRLVLLSETFIKTFFDKARMSLYTNTLVDIDNEHSVVIDIRNLCTIRKALDGKVSNKEKRITLTRKADDKEK